MNCYHLLSTKPTFFGERKEWSLDKKVTYYLDNLRDFDVLTLILSVLKWQEHNGKIHLITDDVGYEVYKKLGLITLWDSVDKQILTELPSDIDPVNFWASNKIHALPYLKPPFFTMDMDFIVWKNIKPFYEGKKVVATHHEAIFEHTYPGKEIVAVEDYEWDETLNWEVEPLNTAFTYWNDEDVINDYVEKSFHYMRNCKADYHQFIPMVFAEQRLLAMVLDQHKIKSETFLTKDFQMHNGEKQDVFTHIWGTKNKYRLTDPKEPNELSEKLLARIKTDYPFIVSQICILPMLKKYFP